MGYGIQTETSSQSSSGTSGSPYKSTEELSEVTWKTAFWHLSIINKITCELCANKQNISSALN